MARPRTTVKQKLSKISFDIKKVETFAGFGLTDIQIGNVLGVSEVTVNKWKKDKQFCLALKKGKNKADSEVIKSLYKRATGFEHPNEIYFSSYRGSVTETLYKKYYVPDVVAQIFWLKNRQPEQWREKVESVVTIDDARELAKIFSTMVLAAGSGKATSGDNPLPDGTEAVQDGSRGPEKLQDGNS